MTLEPKAEGEAGELIVTTLTKGMPALRCRARPDEVTVSPPLRQDVVRMEKVMGRSDDMPRSAASTCSRANRVRDHADRADQPALHARDPARGLSDTLEVQELVDGPLTSRELGLAQTIRAKLRVVLGLDAKVKLVGPTTIERFAGGKAKRIVDLRQGEPAK